MFGLWTQKDASQSRTTFALQQRLARFRKTRSLLLNQLKDVSAIFFRYPVFKVQMSLVFRQEFYLITGIRQFQPSITGIFIDFPQKNTVLSHLLGVDYSLPDES